MSFKVIIAGGRQFNDYETLKRSCDHILKNQSDIEVVSGGAKGADSLGERYATEMGLKCTIFPADWDTHGKSGEPIRNRQMAEYTDALIAFWDGKSRGTSNMIEEAKKKGLKIRIIRY